MILTIEGAGDVEAAPGTPLGAVLAAVGAPAAVWCGRVRLDVDHRVGAAPLLAAARLAVSPGRVAAPRSGPHARVVAGPDAGGALAPADRDAVVGRGGEPALDDPALSRRHLAIDARGRARDLGSRNGTVLIRGGRRRRLGRVRRRLHDGDVLLAGGSAMRWVEDDARAGEPSPVASGPGAGGSTRVAPLLAGIGGAAAGAAAIGAATGRWAMGAAMLAAPLAWALLALARRRRPARTPARGMEELAAVPLPVAVVGEPDVALGIARALAVAREVGPAGMPDEPWARWHERRLPAESVRIVARGGSPPSEARTVIDADAATLTVEGRTRGWHVTAVSAATADALARAAVGAREPGLPGLLRWGDLPPPDRGMTAALGVDQRGPVMLDLDADGPHVLVAGTTGSGKSALLETVVAGLAHAHPPERLGVALVDLKGGAGLGACAALPHARGLLTDLEPGSARRMLLGLAHELRERKRTLARAALPSWMAWEQRGDAAARLLVVVDEFQELGALDPGLLPELARLAAQGRSLGVHLLLATQRPAGAVSPAIRANVATVIALRTATAAESQDLLGDAAAAELPGTSPGRAILASPRGRTTLQAALPVADPTPPVRRVDRSLPPGRPLAEAACARWDARPRPEPLWLPALAEVTSAPPGAFGWIDLPETRDRCPLVWDPADGPLLVVGPRGSGRTTTVDAVAAALPGTVRLPADPREAARTLALAAAARPAALLVDDADVATGRLEPLVRGAPQALEDLARVVPLVIACGPGWGARWAARAGARVILSGLDRIEQQLWGVPPALAGLDAMPGRGVAVTPHASGECRIVPAPCPPTRVLVSPLTCGPRLPAGAVGVVGDDARPLELPREGVAVIGVPGATRDALVASLAAAGVRADVATVTPSGAPIELLADPTPARLRELGVLATLGLAEPAPPPGRVIVRRGATWEAAQLRMPPEPRTVASAVA